MSNQMQVYFPGNKRVYADYKGFTIETDQPSGGGGDDSAPAPFDLFMASIGTCAGIYALGFMQQRGIDSAGSSITMTPEVDPAKGMIGKHPDRSSVAGRLPRGVPCRRRARRWSCAPSRSTCTTRRRSKSSPRRRSDSRQRVQLVAPQDDARRRSRGGVLVQPASRVLTSAARHGESEQCSKEGSSGARPGGSASIG